MTDVVGNIVDLDAGQVLLPAFVERRAEGLFVIAEMIEPAGGFMQFAARVFGAGARFSGLDYATFLNLLYDLTEPVGVPLRLAGDIVPFSPARQALYRTVKIAPDKSVAEYLFEPVELEVSETVPVFGPPGADGNTAVIGEERMTHGVPTQLDFDEFVAALWAKGVRFGIDAAAVRAAIAGSQAVRLDIARAVPATPGSDASIEERTRALHRDNAPKILPDGRMDLRQFKNRFPQITADERLLQKIPRCLGKTGRNVAGELLEPEIPKDYEFAPLAGMGTRVERGADGEFIVAAMDGFLNIDLQTNQVSVTEKIISHEGVSMKTTGDVTLTGDEFEEHGEVQERRVVEGRHMTFFSDVHGKIISRGGRIVLKSCIAGGQASSPGGSIVVMGRASRATLEARGGEIHVEFAEGCTIVASRVTVNQAINCDILGEEVTIGISEGSAIAAKRVKITESKTRKETETLVALLVPDCTRYERDANALEEARQQAEQRVADQDEKLAQLLADVGFKSYLALATTIAKGGAKLSAQHEASWRQAQANFAAQVREWQATQMERGAAQKRLAELVAELAELTDKKLHVGDGIACTIEHIRGDTLVRRLAFQPDHSVVGGEQARELSSHLREFGVSADRLFWGASGEFAWRHDQGACAVGEA